LFEQSTLSIEGSKVIKEMDSNKNVKEIVYLIMKRERKHRRLGEGIS